MVICIFFYVIGLGIKRFRALLYNFCLTPLPSACNWWRDFKELSWDCSSTWVAFCLQIWHRPCFSRSLQMMIKMVINKCNNDNDINDEINYTKNNDDDNGNSDNANMKFFIWYIYILSLKTQATLRMEAVISVCNVGPEGLCCLIGETDECMDSFNNWGLRGLRGLVTLVSGFVLKIWDDNEKRLVYSIVHIRKSQNYVFRSFTSDIFYGLVQDCSNSIANALELLQSCTEPSIYSYSSVVIHWQMWSLMSNGISSHDNLLFSWYNPVVKWEGVSHFMAKEIPFTGTDYTHS